MERGNKLIRVQSIKNGKIHTRFECSYPVNYVCDFGWFKAEEHSNIGVVSSCKYRVGDRECENEYAHEDFLKLMAKECDAKEG